MVGERSSSLRPLHLELHGYVPDSSLSLEHLMLKTQNHGKEIGVSEISPANSYSRAHARMQCKYVHEIENWAPAVRPLRIGYRKQYGPNFSGADYCNVL